MCKLPGGSGAGARRGVRPAAGVRPGGVGSIPPWGAPVLSPPPWGAPRRGGERGVCAAPPHLWEGCAGGPACGRAPVCELGEQSCGGVLQGAFVLVAMGGRCEGPRAAREAWGCPHGAPTQLEGLPGGASPPQPVAVLGTPLSLGTRLEMLLGFQESAPGPPLSPGDSAVRPAPSPVPPSPCSSAPPGWSLGP